MFIMFMWTMLMMFSSLFLQMKHPLSIGMILLIQTFFVSLLTGLILNTFWFSYILFLIFVGGMMVLFIYVTSLASNETFNFSFKILLMMMLMMNSYILTQLIIDKMFMLNFWHNNDTNMFSLNFMFENQNSMNLNKLYNFPMNMLLLMLIVYLFITLILVVKITNIFWGPLRPSN